MLSDPLQRFLRHVLRTTDGELAHLDDAVEVLDARKDGELAILCGCPVGERAVSNQPSLCYSSELRQQLWDELAELELSLPPENAEGWIEDLLDPGALADQNG